EAVDGEATHLCTLQALGGIGEAGGAVGTLPREGDALVLAARVLEHDGPAARGLAYERDAVLVDHDGAQVGGLGRARAASLVIGTWGYHHGGAGARGIDCRLDRLTWLHVQDAGACRNRPSDQQANQQRNGPCHVWPPSVLCRGIRPPDPGRQYENAPPA